MLNVSSRVVPVPFVVFVIVHPILVDDGEQFGALFADRSVVRCARDTVASVLELLSQLLPRRFDAEGRGRPQRVPHVVRELSSIHL